MSGAIDLVVVEHAKKTRVSIYRKGNDMPRVYTTDIDSDSLERIERCLWRDLGFQLAPFRAHNGYIAKRR